MSLILKRVTQIAKNEGIAITALEKKIGASKGVLSRAINKGTDIQAKWLRAVVENYPRYSADWLLTGNGEMIKSSVGYSMPEEAGAMMSDNAINITEYRQRTDDRIVASQGVPLYEIEATAGIVSLFSDYNERHAVNYLTIPDLPPCDGAVHVRGDSMYPLLKSGDIVLYKQIHDVQKIVWGEMYLVAFTFDEEDYVAVKYIKKVEGAPGDIMLVSYNTHHAALQVPISDVRALALVKASVRYNTMG